MHNSLLLNRIQLLVVAACLSCPAMAAAQSYDHTTFLHGINADSTTWNVGAQKLSTTLDLKVVSKPDLGGTLSVYAQRDALLNKLHGSLAGRHILVAHSMGGLVARATYLADSADVAGIVTVATPHAGAPIAQNIFLLRNFTTDMSRRVSDGAFAVIGEVVEAATPADWASTGIGAVVSGAMDGLRHWVNNEVRRIVGDYFDDQYHPSSDAMQDLRPASPTISALQQRTDDAVPHAIVYGEIPRRHAVFRLNASSENGGNGVDEARLNHVVRLYNMTREVFKACKVLGYTVLRSPNKARRCSYANRTLGRIDDRVAAYVIGSWSYPGTVCGEEVLGRTRCYTVTQTYPDNGSFDGTVPTSRANYPGLSDPNFIFRASMMNHVNIKWRQEGLEKISAAMVKVRVAQR